MNGGDILIVLFIPVQLHVLVISITGPFGLGNYATLVFQSKRPITY